MCKNGRIWRWVDHTVGHSTLKIIFFLIYIKVKKLVKYGYLKKRNYQDTISCLAKPQFGTRCLSFKCNYGIVLSLFLNNEFIVLFQKSRDEMQYMKIELERMKEECKTNTKGNSLFSEVSYLYLTFVHKADAFI